MPLVVVSAPVKERLDLMQAERKAALGRNVTLAEVIEVLVAEHDRKWPVDENGVPR